MSVQQSLITQITQQQEMANQLVRDSETWLGDAARALRFSWHPGRINPDYEIQAEYSPPRLKSPGTIRTPDTKSTPGKPQFLTPEEITVETWPGVRDIDTSGLFQHQEPGEVAEFEESFPRIDTNLDIPDAPGLANIPFPDLLDIEAPPAPGKPQIPDYDGQTAVFRGAIPHELETTFWRLFRALRDEMLTGLDRASSEFVQRFFPQHEALHSAVDDHLLSHMQGTTTALPAHYQDTVYRRAQAQVDAQARRVIDEATNGARLRGYYHAPGALHAAIGQATAEAARNQGDAAMQAASRVAELEQQFTQFVMQTISTAREQAIQAFHRHWDSVMAVNRVALDMARSLCALVLEIQDRWLHLYQLDQSNIELDIRVWETRVKYVMVDLEIHKQLLEVQALRAKLNDQQIRVLEARIALDERLLKRYGLELDALGKLVDVKTLELRLFEGKVNAYLGYVRGKEANANIFESLMRGDRLKLEGELANLQADQARAGIIDSKIRAQAEANRARGQYNADRIAVWKTEVDKILADYGMERAAQDGDIAAARLAIGENEVRLRDALQKFSTESQNDRTRLDMQREVLQIQSDRTMRHGQLLLDQNARLADINKEAAEVSSNMAASLVAGFTTLLQASSVETTETVA